MLVQPPYIFFLCPFYLEPSETIILLARTVCRDELFLARTLWTDFTPLIWVLCMEIAAVGRWWCCSRITPLDYSTAGVGVGFDNIIALNVPQWKAPLKSIFNYYSYISWKSYKLESHVSSFDSLTAVGGNPSARKKEEEAFTLLQWSQSDLFSRIFIYYHYKHNFIYYHWSRKIIYYLFVWLQNATSWAIINNKSQIRNFTFYSKEKCRYDYS